MINQQEIGAQNRSSLIALSWVSFFWSTATMIVFSILPIFLTEVLGVTHTQVGFLEGFSVFCAFASKFVSGILSDIIRTRKPIIVIGTILSFLVKIMFGLAHSYLTVFTAQFIDRVSKGIRSSPTDALIADLSRGDNQGRFYGIRQSLYTFGAAAGTLLASGAMYLTDRHYRTVFFLAIIPGVFALLILLFKVKQPPIPHEIPHENSKKWRISDIKYLPPLYWALLGVVAVLMMARFSAYFLSFRLRSLGMDTADIPIVLFGYEIIHASIAYYIGFKADQMDRHKLLLLGFITLIVTDLTLILAMNIPLGIVGVLLAGLHMGMTQGLIATLIAEASPADTRGTAFALYYLVCGIFVWLGNVVAGQLSDTYGISASFMGGGTFTTIAALLLVLLITVKKRHA